MVNPIATLMGTTGIDVHIFRDHGTADQSVRNSRALKNRNRKGDVFQFPENTDVQRDDLIQMQGARDMWRVIDIEDRMFMGKVAAVETTVVRHIAADGIAPPPGPETRTTIVPRTGTKQNVFISYSRKDKNWLDKLLTMLAPMLHNRTIDVWYDGQIRPSENWRKEIENAMATASVAVMLVTDHFLASDFISNNELPYLLKAGDERGVKILWVSVSSCMYEQTDLKDIQCVNEPAKPLDNFKSAAQKAAIKKICVSILNAYQNFQK
jgi:hypothetical protein